MEEKRQSSLVTGAILILLGVGFFALQFMEGFGEAVIFFLIGGAFMVGYLFRRAYGLLIPGASLLVWVWARSERVRFNLSAISRGLVLGWALCQFT